MLWVLVALSALLLAASDSLVHACVALLICNATYPTASLRSPVNDGCAIRDALTEAGVKLLVLENGTEQQMVRAVASLSRKLGPDTASLFQFADLRVRLEMSGVSETPDE